MGAPDDPILAEMVQRLIEALRPERIYLFGSTARGEAGPDSDYDLLVVVPAATGPGYRLGQRVLRPARVRVGRLARA